MKKIVAVLLTVLLMAAVSCGGDVSEVEIAGYSSEIYTDSDIEAAMDTAISYFKSNYPDGKLKKISYGGDDMLDEYKDQAQRYNADEVIVLIHDYLEYDPDNPAVYWRFYRDRRWVLVRNKNGKWRMTNIVFWEET